MEQGCYEEYLSLLTDLADTLGRLSKVEQEKTAAVLKDDLLALNAFMKQEQALTLKLRGFDRRREQALSALGLDGIPLSGMAGRFPEELRMRARSVEEELRRQYTLYQGAADVARTTLECNLHQVEKTIASMGVEPAAEAAPALPKSMKTDFRA